MTRTGGWSRVLPAPRETAGGPAGHVEGPLLLISVPFPSVRLAGTQRRQTPSSKSGLSDGFPSRPGQIFKKGRFWYDFPDFGTISQISGRIRRKPKVETRLKLG